MLRRETVEYTDGETNVVLIVSEASVVAGIRRGVLKGEASRLSAQAGLMDMDEDDTDLALFLLRSFTYPDLITATVEADGIEWPLSFEAFCELPERLVDVWEHAVYRLNPHWRPSLAMPEEVKKKATTSTGD